jgi:hypothetical protein
VLAALAYETCQTVSLCLVLQVNIMQNLGQLCTDCQDQVAWACVFNAVRAAEQGTAQLTVSCIVWHRGTQTELSLKWVSLVYIALHCDNAAAYMKQQIGHCTVAMCACKLHALHNCTVYTQYTCDSIHAVLQCHLQSGGRYHHKKRHKKRTGHGLVTSSQQSLHAT